MRNTTAMILALLLSACHAPYDDRQSEAYDRGYEEGYDEGNQEGYNEGQNDCY